MFAIPEFTVPAKRTKDTMIPLVLALAIAVAGLVKPEKGPSNEVTATLSQFDAARNAGAQNLQGNTK